MITTSLVYIDSPVGLIRLEGKASALTRLHFVEKRTDAEENPAQLKKAVDQLNEFFAGQRLTFDLELNPEGTHFQRNVWDELMKIPFGKTCCYEDLARKLGDIKVIRAAATANGRNPLAIIVPCHRVIGKDGSLTGYSGGLHRKKWLLDFEQRDAQPKLL